MNTASNTNLAQCKEGEKVTVNRVLGSGPFRKRLLEMGVIKGESLNIVKYAPLRDPIEVVLNGYHLTLRVEEAELISVTKNGEAQ